MCAILNGKSIDTSMGFTPLEGLIMGTRSGDIDAGVIFYFSDVLGWSTKQIQTMLFTESGLKGLAGESDVRALLEREVRGDKRAKFALDIFAYRFKKYVGAYFGALNGLDILVLGGGISRAPRMRARLLSNLECFGIEPDNSKLSCPAPILLSCGKVPVLVLETDEQEALYQAAQAFLEKKR